VTAVFVRFRVSGSAYAVPVEVAREVRPREALTPLPDPHPGVAGLLRLRDDALPVLSIFGDGREHVLVLEAASVRFGLLVDVVEGVVRVPDGDVGPPPAGQRQDYALGVLGGGDEVVLILDVAAMAPLISR
jgi:purine-binding chemotaxis protein CheW